MEESARHIAERRHLLGRDLFCLFELTVSPSCRGSPTKASTEHPPKKWEASTTGSTSHVHGTPRTISGPPIMNLIEKLLIGIVAFQGLVLVAWLTMVRKEMKEKKLKVH